METAQQNNKKKEKDTKNKMFLELKKTQQNVI